MQCTKQVGGFVAGFDVFGSPITLKFKGNDRYKTVMGGLITLLVYGAFYW